MAKKETISYEIDPFNRLVYRKSSKTSSVTGFRTVIDGEFKTGENNQLSYCLKKPSSTTPQELKLSGNWSLDRNHNLIFTLDKENNQQAKDKLKFEGKIIDAKDNKLVLELATKDCRGNPHFYLLKLTGSWRIDKHNRLNFIVTKETGQVDQLKFCGSWDINKQNQLIYTYTQTQLKTKEKLIHSLAFKGYWNITKKNRLTYILNKETGLCFNFRVGVAKPLKRGLEYEVAIGATAKKKFTLYGSWKINQALGLLFEMPYEEGKIRNILFGANCSIDKQTNLNLKVKNTAGGNMGFDLKLSKMFLHNIGECYIKALKDGKEISLLAGAGFRW